MKPSPELIKLVDKCLAKNITRVEMAQLEQLLDNDASLQYYLEITGIEGDIPLALEAGIERESSLHTQNIFARWTRPLSIGAAAVVLFSIGLYSGKKVYSPPSPKGEITNTQPGHQPIDNGAAITSLIGVTWEGDAPEFIKLSSESQSLAIKSGLVELTFDSGVRTLIEGPAAIEVTGGNSANLGKGRMVANVPKGAEGFTVEYPDGRVIDLGTEFALNIPQNQKGAEIGVFRGEVEIYDRKQNIPLKVLEDHAMIQISGSRNPFASIPFQREDYIRELPSREFPWRLPEQVSTSPATLEFDVSHLVWKSGNYRAVFKHMQGGDALVIHQADLLLDGQIITSDDHLGRTGLIHRTIDNIYTFNISDEQHQKGKWILRVSVSADARSNTTAGTFSPDSSGILLFEDTTSTHATDASYVGTWEFRHNGMIHQRIFTADRRAQYRINGESTSLYDDATWNVEDGILVLTIPASQGEPIELRERHMLRNERELIFTNRPYRNAVKVE